MMKLFDQLRDEHVRISAALDALESFCERFEDRKEDVHELLRFVTFLRGFADGYHHEREEMVLFRCLVQVGYAPALGPIGHLRDQHREEARLLMQLEMTSALLPPWTQAKRDAIRKAAAALIAFERAHMVKESELLFPVAVRDLAGHHRDLEEANERFSQTRAPRWDVSWLTALGDELVAAHSARRA